MIDFDWKPNILKDQIELADCIELVVAFSASEYGGRFTRTNFRDVVVKDILDVEDDDDAIERIEERIDSYSRYYDDAKELIRRRALWLGDVYPFKLDGNTVFFSPSGPRKYLAYLLLLMCSCHQRIPGMEKKLPTDFEYLCKEAMRSLFPDWADVFLFSQYSEDRDQMGLPAREAVPSLAAKLNASLVDADNLPSTREEYGIDVIAISSFDDDLGYPFFAFAQCTVAKNWWPKRGEARYENGLDTVITLNTTHSNFLLIPHFPRISAGRWEVFGGRRRVGNCILCDRYRICRLLDRSRAVEEGQLPSRLTRIFRLIEASVVAV